MERAIVLVLFFNSVFCCKDLWDNTCTKNADCCSNNCENPNGWATGVCKQGSGQAQPAAQPAAGGNTGGGGKGDLGSLTESQFKQAFTSNGYPEPNHDQFLMCKQLAQSAGGISDKQELAMFLAEIMWESGGLRFKKEIACETTGCPNEYRTGQEDPKKFYYGRGYIQLTWIYNYKACSQDLYGDDRLVQNPDLASDTEAGAWGTALWFWKKNVHPNADVQRGCFGAATNAINGALECRGAYQDKARKRFELYKKILTALAVNVTPNETGCYN